MSTVQEVRGTPEFLPLWLMALGRPCSLLLALPFQLSCSGVIWECRSYLGERCRGYCHRTRKPAGRRGSQIEGPLLRGPNTSRLHGWLERSLWLLQAPTTVMYHAVGMREPCYSIVCEPQVQPSRGISVCRTCFWLCASPLREWSKGNTSSCCKCCPRA